MYKRGTTIGILLLILVSCGTEQSEKEQSQLLTANEFKAVPMPDKLITGNPFPTDSTTINKWVASSSEVNNLETNGNIIGHGWGIWQALTEYTDQENNGQKLRRFETWFTPDDIIAAYKNREKNEQVKLHHVKRNRGDLKTPNQFHASMKALPDPGDAGVIGFVKYDPTAAEHIYENDLFYKSTLKKMVKKDQIANIPDFPNSGVSLKPVFKTLTDPNDKGLYSVPVWPGEEGDPERKFPSSDWDHSVFVTIDGETETSQNIYSINDFIHFQLDSAQAQSRDVKPGTYAVLAGMHVTTREITRWTWQTFWWSESPNNPYSPSSGTIAGYRPSKKLDRGANHYAMAVAYNMVQPAQPERGGSGADATSLYAYNPYLEAGFGDSTFIKGNEAVRKYYPKSYQKVGEKMNLYGMQTNCMSCHGQARFDPQSVGTHFYLTDQYFSMDAPYFKNKVKVDFTWSIIGNLIDDNGERIKVNEK
ncbi:hypothetical protein [Fodinibius halophilus]|uniref:Uncharacterized protein n=1 Tax=Fodinibius halophilus TaxID=1736908 RepID=A0A6M1SZB0_9BACT|nr:hypothetical protein [Fodinibius halophilus]NGP86997.1 hypothetical protein [Fodinibius halophilus]